jgi:NADPH-dependent 2,4-dienoyl-CoA reductase/sulfur reductase-like enzyme/nitrite reductase/ring-hydroxylating ferredoxin subunit
MRAVKVYGTDILLVRLDGEFYALGAHCTHKGAPLKKGRLEGDRIICPWHDAHFDARTGKMLEPPARDCLEQFDCRVEDGEVIVRSKKEADESRPPEMVDRKLGSDPRRFFIIGGGAAGSAAAEELRRTGYQGRVFLITEEETMPYDRTALSKSVLEGEVEFDDAVMRDDDFYRDSGIDVMLGRKVVKVDTYAQRIHFDNGEMREYDRLLVATGSTPVTPSMQGGSQDHVFTLRKRGDVEAILKAMTDEDDPVEHVAVVGSSFIGLETAASLATRGLGVSVITDSKVPFEHVLGEELGTMYRELHEQHGVTFYFDDGVERVNTKSVRLESGETIPADIVIIGTGVEPSGTDILHGIEPAEDGGLDVNDEMYVVRDVWAAGDIARFVDPRTGERTRIEHWRLAEQQGRVAASAMADTEPDERIAYTAVPYFWTRQYGITLKYVGHAAKWDDVVIDGSLDERDFTAYFLSGDRVLAACGTQNEKVSKIHPLLGDPEPPTLDDLQSAIG